MYRTGRRRFWRQLGLFLWENSRLLLFLSLLFAGVAVGCAVHPHIAGGVDTLLPLLGGGAMPPNSGIASLLAVFFQNSVWGLLLLALLMLAGMSLCGVPVCLLVPLLYGFGMGLCEAALLQNSGALALLLRMPAALLSIWALLMACAEAFRFTLRLTGQVLPNSMQGGLWRDFKLYCLRFLLCFGIVLSGAGAQTLFVWWWG